MISVHAGGKNTENLDGRAAMYAARISDAGLAVLETLIGRTIHRIYAPCLQVAGPHVTAPVFSIPITDQVDGQFSQHYVVVCCEWLETFRTFTDYWRVQISDEDKPKGIETTPSNAIMAPCTINDYHATPIHTIEIHRVDSSAGAGPNSEIVSYDNAILFRLEGGRSACIACQLDGPGIATEVHFSQDDQVISEFLQDSRVRVSISARSH